MNVRDRALAVLNHQKPDYVPWFGDLSYWIGALDQMGKLEDKYKGEGVHQMYRDLGVGYYLQGYFPFQAQHSGINIKNDHFEQQRITTVETPVGTVRETWKYLPESFTWGPQEHFIKGVEDLRVIRYWYENTTYIPNYTMAARTNQLISDNGLSMCYLPRSPLMQMVAELAGIETMTYAMLDDQNEFEKTMVVLREKADQAAQVALDSPAECLMIPENLSSEVVGKSFFEKYMRPYEEKWNKKILEAKKHSFVHMDGTLKGLITETASTGFKVLEALTPAPVGDIPFEEISRYVPSGTIIWGGIPGLYFTDMISDKAFDCFVIDILKVMKTQSRYVLGVADQVPPGARWDRVARVAQLVQRYGKYDYREEML